MLSGRLESPALEALLGALRLPVGPQAGHGRGPLALGGEGLRGLQGEVRRAPRQRRRQRTAAQQLLFKAIYEELMAYIELGVEMWTIEQLL